MRLCEVIGWTVLLTLAAVMLASCDSQVQKDARQVAQGMPSESLAKTTTVEARQLHAEARSLRQDVEKTPEAELPARKAQIVQRLVAIEQRALKLEAFGTQLQKRVENDKPVLQGLQAWGVRLLAGGIAALVLGAGLLAWRGQAWLLWIGATLAAIGAMFWFIGVVLWWAALGAIFVAVGIVAVLLWKRFGLFDAAVRVVRSIDAGVEQGVIKLAERSQLKAVLDPIQGVRGKALVDMAKGLPAAAEAAPAAAKGDRHAA